MRPTLSVVIPAHNEAEVIGELVHRLVKWKRKPEVIVVANGCTDDTVALARHRGATVLEFPTTFGHDVGRAIGAEYAAGEIVLFVDGDILWTLQDLEPFVAAVEQGTDLALNEYPHMTSTRYYHPTALAKHALNLFLHRSDLCAASLTAVPNAISRQALHVIGSDSLAIPPVAQAMAVLHGLRVEAVSHVPVGTMNPLRGKSKTSAVKRLIIGDCLEAIAVIHEQTGERGGFSDLERRRDMVKELLGGLELSQAPSRSDDVEDAVPPRTAADESTEFENQVLQLTDQSTEMQSIGDALPHRKVLAVIPARNEGHRLRATLENVIRSGIDAMCVVCNGSVDDTTRVALRLGAVVEEFSDPLGHDVGRAVGCILHAADAYVFTDGDLQVARADLRQFSAALERVDVALNDLDRVVPRHRQRDGSSVAKRFMNLVIGRPDLGIASLTAVPHAMRSLVIDAIGRECLAVPPLAQAKAILAGFRVEAVHPVNVIGSNRYRVKLHSRQHGKPLEQLILGDHLEAIHYIQEKLGVRTFFPDEIRKRDILENWPSLVTVHATRKAKSKNRAGADLVLRGRRKESELPANLTAWDKLASSVHASGLGIRSPVRKGALPRRRTHAHMTLEH